MAAHIKRILIKEFEGLRLTAYQDISGTWTVGWGHTGPEVHQGLVWTQAQADAQLLLDLGTFEAGVWTYLTRVPTQGQFDAMVDIAYNIGLGAFTNSTLLRKFNAGDTEGAAREFGRWIYAANVFGFVDNPYIFVGLTSIVAGLVNRRVAEVIVFLS